MLGLGLGLGLVLGLGLGSGLGLAALNLPAALLAAAGRRAVVEASHSSLGGAMAASCH